MSSEFIEIEEKTIDEAIEKACQEFGVPREKLNIEIISGESGGFLGLFSKKAKIRASLLALDIDFSFSDNPREKAEKPKERNEPRVKPENSGVKIEAKAASRKKPEKEAAGEQPPVKKEPEVFIPASPIAIQARDLLAGILQRISPEYGVTVNETQEKIILGIEGDESGLLIGKRGQNLDAFQYIINKAVNKLDGEHKMVLIDSGEYRKRREDFLLGLAEKIKKKVKKTKKPVSLSNMNAHDRRIIHLVMQEDETLVTQSRGEGKYRKIVILPAKTGSNRRIREKKRD
ncbi:MAG TPA: RNA-binding cell elongation regulator Jag/EloR [Smithella sp.]|nr:RNA-binding cell elongation regulator Jag/EloR [Smithella sp.]